MSFWKAYGLPDPTLEFQFHPKRRWRFDFAWPQWKVALEQEGGIWSKGRHVRAKGYLDDMEKYSISAIMGWCVIRTSPQQIMSKGIYWVGLALTIRCCPVLNVGEKEIEQEVGVCGAWPNIDARFVGVT